MLFDKIVQTNPLLLKEVFIILEEFPYDPGLAKLYSQDKLEYCLTCNTSSNKLKFAIVT